MLICYNKHERVSGEKISTVIAMCDEDLIGKKLKGKNAVLDLVTYASFYKGELIESDEAAKIVKSFFSQPNVSFNLVGKHTLAALKGVVNVSKAKKIGAVPHLQVYTV